MAKGVYVGVDGGNGVNIVNAGSPIGSVVGNGNISKTTDTVIFNYIEAKDTYFFLKITETLYAGEQYEVSFDCSGIDAETTLTILIDNKQVNPIKLQNGRLSRVFTPDRNISGTLLMDDIAPWVNVIGKEIILSNFCVEKYTAYGVARKISKGYVGVGGVARNITKAYVGDESGIARLCWSKE